MVRLKTVSKKALRERNLKSYQENTKAALSLQRWYRGYVARREVGRVKKAVTRLQAGTRGRLARKQLGNEKQQAMKIQKLFRGHQARKKVTAQIEDQTCNLAATMVQARLRAVIHRRRLRKTIKSGIKLQAAWRGYYVRRRFREEYDRKAQIIIQSRMFESKKVQWYLERERQVMRSKIAVFREWAHSAGKRRAIARMRDTAALTIQRCFRGYLAKRQRGALRDERQRGKELTKFVELLRSHMSMVIFEEKEKHTLAFPVKGGKAAKKQEAGLPAIRTASSPPQGRSASPVQRRGGGGGGREERLGDRFMEGGGGRVGGGGNRSRAAGRDRPVRGQSDENRSRRNGGARREGGGARSRGAEASGRRSAGGGQRRRPQSREHDMEAELEPEPSRGGGRGGGRGGQSGGPTLRKAEIEDALALADLLNLGGDTPAGGGGNEERRRKPKPKGGQGGQGGRARRAAQPAGGGYGYDRY